MKKAILFISLFTVFGLLSASQIFLKDNNPKKYEQRKIASKKNGALSTNMGYGIGGNKVDSIAEAKKKIESEIKIPEFTDEKKLSAIWVKGAPTPERKGLELLYGENEIYITIYPNNPSLKDFDKFKENLKDMLPRVKDIEVNGHKGIGAEPGYQITEDGEIFNPGFVDWFDGNDEYIVYGQKPHISLNTLLKIARSMK